MQYLEDIVIFVDMYRSIVLYYNYDDILFWTLADCISSKGIREKVEDLLAEK